MIAKSARLLVVAFALFWSVAALADQPAKVTSPWFMTAKLSSQVSVSTTSAPVEFPVGAVAANVARLCNTGQNDAYYVLGFNSSLLVTVGSGSWIKSGTCIAVDLFPQAQYAEAFSYVAFITAAGTTSIYVEVGLGAPPTDVVLSAGSGGGSGGGGGGSVTQGTIPWISSISNWPSTWNIGNWPSSWIVNQGTNPWAVSVGNWPSSWTVNQGVSAWTVGVNNFPSSWTVVQPTGTNLHTVCDSGCSGGSVFQGTSPWIISGAVTQGTTPWIDNLTQWAGTSLGAPTAWGSAPSGNVPGVNANVLAAVLPANAATAANQPTNAAQGSATSSQTGNLHFGAVTTSPPSYSNGQSDALSLTPGGSLRIDHATVAGVALGAPSNYGTSPGAVEVLGVNAFVTNPVATTGAASAYVDGWNVTEGTKGDAAWPFSGSASIVSLLKALAASENATISHIATTALASSLLVKNSTGNLYAFNCTAITGGAAGYCVAYNAASVPGAGALTGSQVLDFCYLDGTPRGCALSRLPKNVAYSNGIAILVTTATSPYTYTSGTDTAAISGDYN